MSCMPAWVPILDSNIKKGGPIFYFSTVDPHDGSPKVRTCVSRGWLFGDKNNGILTLTTDKRMPKVDQMSKTGGKFEGCFWFPETSIQVRISGTTQCLIPQENEYPVSLIGSSLPGEDANDSSHISSSVSSSASSASSSSSYLLDPKYSLYPIISPSYKAGEAMTRPCPPSKEEWDSEYDRIWDSIVGKVKSSFRFPVPGSKMTLESRKTLDSIMRGVDGSNPNDGKANFVVVLMLVNKVDIFDDTKSLRVVYTRRKGDEWKEEEVSP